MCIPDLYDLYDLCDLALVFPGGSRTACIVEDIVFWAGSVLLIYRSCRISQHGRLGSTVDDLSAHELSMDDLPVDDLSDLSVDPSTRRVVH